VVADSWRRCAACGVRPDGSRLPPLCGTAEQLAAYRRTHPLLAVLPLFRELLGAGAADDGHVFAVGDTDGTLLWVEGDTAAMERAELMHFAEGAVWSEAQAGTNAPSLVLELGRPVQIVTGEHYSAAAHGWSCAAAPIRVRHGATLTHIRRYLGHVSDRMAEHYVHLTQSDLDEVLQHVWVAGPGTAHPGELLTSNTTPLTREQAQTLAIDLSRRSTPAEGGFCTFQPVVNGRACPWNLDGHNCDKFVLSGADLLYLRRKREQWRLLAQGAPDDYLHRYFEPTARAIDGLEKALAGLGLLDDALALDLRKPQDYFHRVWSTAFRAADLADAGGNEDDERSEYSDTCTVEDTDSEQDVA
jgi:hypothetical protein